MTVRRIDIRNYRGIRELTWHPGAGLTCLIGPGNSTKTTILDALALTLSPRFSVSLSDSDFFDCQVDERLRSSG